MTKELSELTSQDVFDSRDLIERLEELKEERESLREAIEDAQEVVSQTYTAREENPNEQTVAAHHEAMEDERKAREELSEWDKDYKEELDELERINDECSGYGDWEHGEAMISEDYFEDYAQELAEELGAVGKNSSWIVIDWESTANNLKQDYSEVEIDGKTWYYRA